MIEEQLQAIKGDRVVAIFLYIRHGFIDSTAYYYECLTLLSREGETAH